MDFYELIIDMMLINIHLYIFIPTAVIVVIVCCCCCCCAFFFVAGYCMQVSLVHVSIFLRKRYFSQTDKVI